ncbi:MAG: 16S rRNA (cytosine(1402)-N(4))-methyltransferase RsmH [Elusimicrobia bacterium]|nr:16S rRNA (cytosine(1402)-N(4))-methyltransferase RsmH [Elusimicrobiota bacterium]
MTVTLPRPVFLVKEPMEYEHEPVLLEEVLRHLVNEPAGFYLDATLGLGGHSEAILNKISAQGRLLGLDMDPEALHAAGERLKAHPGQFRAVRANFRTLGQVLEAEKFFPLAGALFDLGISSMHFEKPERGFSFSVEGPLDMRLSPDNPLTAGMIVNNWPAEQLALLLKEFGEEPAANRIARAIAARRQEKAFATTTELASFIAGFLPRGRTHAATRTFMALRIAVNAELENLTRGLESVLPYLRQGGRIAVISFHSLEDRIVKNIFSSFVEQGACRYLESAGGKPPISPSVEEVARNPRARSAKLRIVEKLS